MSALIKPLRDAERQRDEARAEVERLRAEASSVLDANNRALAGLQMMVEFATSDLKRMEAERDEARAHTSTAAFMRIERERDEARAEVARREREHAALLETAQKALATTEAERDEARAEVRVLLAEIDAERRERASAVLAAVEAAEERGAEWMLAHAQSEVWSKDDYGVQWQDVRSPSEICRDARGAGAEWQRDLDGCNAIIDRLKARLGDK